METTRVIGKRILLVDDERWVRECIKRLLALDSHEITEASNGPEAVALFAEAKPPPTPIMKAPSVFSLEESQ